MSYTQCSYDRISNRQLLATFRWKSKRAAHTSRRFRERERGFFFLLKILLKNLAVETMSHALFMDFIIRSVVVNRKPKRNAVLKNNNNKLIRANSTRFSFDKKTEEKYNKRSNALCCASTGDCVIRGFVVRPEYRFLHAFKYRNSTPRETAAP